MGKVQKVAKAKEREDPGLRKRVGRITTRCGEKKKEQLTLRSLTDR
jgi:hypothetical protein